MIVWKSAPLLVGCARAILRVGWPRILQSAGAARGTSSPSLCGSVSWFLLAHGRSAALLGIDRALQTACHHRLAWWTRVESATVHGYCATIKPAKITARLATARLETRKLAAETETTLVVDGGLLCAGGDGLAAAGPWTTGGGGLDEFVEVEADAEPRLSTAQSLHHSFGPAARAQLRAQAAGTHAACSSSDRPRR